MGSTHEVRKLAELFVEVFEVGTRKSERDVADEVLEAFGISLKEIEKDIGLKNGIASKAQDRIRLRELIVNRLMEQPLTVEELMNVVAQNTSKFLEMLDVIYDFLSTYDATTGGTSEEFRFKLGDVQLDISLSKAFLETVRKYVESIVQVQVGKIDSDKLMKILGVDGDFYGSWPIRTFSPGEKVEDNRNIARDINCISWLKREVGNRTKTHPEWNAVKQDLQTLEQSVGMFIQEAQSLIQAHVNYLKREKQLDLEYTANRTDGYQQKAKEIERSLLLDLGLLKSGLYSRKVGLQEHKEREWVHVNVERLLGSSNKIGETSDCLVSMANKEYEGFYGSAVGALAALCGLWKAGVIRKPDDNSIIMKHLKGNDAKRVSHWVLDLSNRSRSATEWLKHEVWEPTGFEHETRIVEVSENYLNLPLWRQRWLLYEIWLVVVTIKAAIAAAWKCKLNFDKTSEGDFATWLLPKGKATAPCATLSLAFDPWMKLDVWYQGRIVRNGIDIMPDVAIRTTGKNGRDLVIIEGKDRFRMPIRTRKGGALVVGRKYSASSGANITWIVNLCAFSGKKLNDPDVNYGNPWQGLYFASEMKPRNIPERFERSVASALIPVDYREFSEVVRFPQEMVFVIDTAGSMHGHLERIHRRILEFIKNTQLERTVTAFWAILFGDHDPRYQEPYLIEELGPFQSIDLLVQKIKQMPLTNGGDTPEALEDAILACCNLSERRKKRLAVVIITDASPHTKSECPNRIDFAEEVGELLNRGNYCFVVNEFLEKGASSCWLPFQESKFFRWLDLFSNFGESDFQEFVKAL